MDETETVKPFVRSEYFDSLSWSSKYDVTAPSEPGPTWDIMSFEYAFIEAENLDKSPEGVVGNEVLCLYGYVFHCTPVTWAHASPIKYFLKTIYVWTRLVPSGLVLLVTCDIGGPIPPLVRGSLASHLLFLQSYVVHYNILKDMLKWIFFLQRSIDCHNSRICAGRVRFSKVWSRA